MDFEAFREIAEAAMKDHPVWFALQRDQDATDEQIAQAEQELRVALPDDYKDFVQHFGGGYFGFAVVYSLDADSDWYILSMNEKYKKFRDGHVLVSETQSGDFYGFRIAGDRCLPSIDFFDHDESDWRETRYSDLFDLLLETGLRQRQ